MTPLRLTRKSVIVGMSVLAACALLGFYVYKSFADRASSQSFDELLARVAAEANTSLPKMIDRETRLDATRADRGKRFYYLYTLVNYTRAGMDTLALRRKIQPTLVANYKTNEQMSQFRDENVELHYQYKDKNGDVLFEIAVSPADF